jgi:hypothetical protein
MSIHRSHVGKHTGDTKTEGSEEELPIHEDLFAVLEEWREEQTFRHTYRAMIDELKISLEEQRTLMRHEDSRTTLGYGGKSKAETGRAASARVVKC